MGRLNSKYLLSSKHWFVLCVLLLLAPIPISAEDFGHYVGRVAVTWEPDGRFMTLLEPFGYIDPAGKLWDAPKGSKVDGASIPRVAWSLLGGPFEDKYRDASVIHDVACNRREKRWQDVHLTFYTGMLASGVSATKAKLMYAAVYHFGPRWEVISRKEYVPMEKVQEEILSIEQTARKDEVAKGRITRVPNPFEPSSGWWPGMNTADIEVIFTPKRSPLIYEGDLTPLVRLIEKDDVDLGTIEDFMLGR